MKLTSELQDSIELRFSSLARTKNAKGEKIISLGLGEPSFPTPPEVIEAAYMAMRQGMTRYSSPFGITELREAIVDKLQNENQIRSHIDQIMITPGAKMALSLVLAAILQPGDEIICITPCYPSYLPQIRIAEPDAVIHVVDLKMSDFTMDVEKISNLISKRTKAVIINFPHNPTGRMLTQKELDSLEEILSNNNCWLISDEIYERLNFSEMKHLSPAAVPSLADRTITINGFSKAFSMTGWRIGYLCARGPVMKIISRLQQHMNTNVAPFIQKAALTALALPFDFLNNYNLLLKNNSQKLVSSIAMLPKLKLVPSEGGLFAFLNIEKMRMTSDRFCSELLETQQVAATPGIVFGNSWDSHVRISLACDTEKFSEGIDRLSEFALLQNK